MALEKETAAAAAAMLLLLVLLLFPAVVHPTAGCWVLVLGSARSKMAGGGGPQVGRRLQHSL